MTDSINDSQIAYTKGLVHMSSDLLAQHKSALGHTSALTQDSRSQAPQSGHGTNASFWGQKQTYKLPIGSLIKSQFLVLDGNNSTAGDWPSYPGSAIYRRFQLRSSGSTVQEFQPNHVVMYLLTKMRENVARKFLSLIGGSSYTGGRFVVPLPFFWDPLCNQDQASQPLNTYPLSSELDVELTCREENDLFVGNVVDPLITEQNISILTVHTDKNYVAENNEGWNFSGYDFISVLPQNGKSLATATTATLDLSSVQGSISRFLFFDQLDTELAAGSYEPIKVQGDTSKIEFKLDGRTIQNDLVNRQKIAYTDMVNSNWAEGEVQSSLGSPAGISFAVFSSEPNIISGSLHRSHFNRITVDYEHSAGAAATIEALALVHARWFYNNGTLQRVYT